MGEEETAKYSYGGHKVVQARGGARLSILWQGVFHPLAGFIPGLSQGYIYRGAKEYESNGTNGWDVQGAIHLVVYR